MRPVGLKHLPTHFGTERTDQPQRKRHARIVNDDGVVGYEFHGVVLLTDIGISLWCVASMVVLPCSLSICMI